MKIWYSLYRNDVCGIVLVWVCKPKHVNKRTQIQGGVVQRAFSITNNKIILNFTLKYCSSEIEILESEGFFKVFEGFLHKLSKSGSYRLKYFDELGVSKNLQETLTDVFKLLLVLSSAEISKIKEEYKKIVSSPDMVVGFIEEFYNYWRRHERYAVIHASKQMSGIQNVNFIDEMNNFTDLILKLYRTIEEKLNGQKHHIYRQLSAGVSAGLVVYPLEWPMLPKYDFLKPVLYIDTITIRPPFISYPQQTTRDGYFKEVDSLNLGEISIDGADFLCYPAWVGESLAYVYFHQNLMSHGVALCNLFELAKLSECEGRKPDLIYIFGADTPMEEESCYFHDKESDIFVGVAKNCEKVDYFGYMKKMLLTLHNVRMIEQGNLPIHGAFVNITLKNGKEANVAIIGDSGAGKSESLEAFRILSEEYLQGIKIIFDDMGSFNLTQKAIVGYGTEVGAFVRLDDLENSYAYNQMDRAIFMNPDKVNARLIMPVSTYSEIMQGYPVDILLYANNYVEKERVLEFFEDKDEAIKCFKKGARRAKGTTTETGIVESYFANPFGPYQRQGETNLLLDRYFDKLYELNIPVGQIYTKLAIDGKEQSGPQEAAKALFDWVMKNK